MRLLKLQIKNFISIKQASIDFEALNDGVFLISGPTGSGKSSMLDAIHWVLFGKTLSSNRATVTKEIRSTYAPANEDTVVTLTFTQDKVDYKVIRALKKDGGTAVQLFAPGIIYDKVKEANEHLEKIIGLTVKQFDQMVMLEQGNFSKFLLADSRTRAEILRDIFDTQLFKDLELRFKDRCADLKNIILNSTELEQSLLQGEMLDTIKSQITLTAETITEEQARRDELKQRQQEAEEALPALITYDQQYSVYMKAQKELEQLDSLKGEVEELYRKREIFTTYSGIIDWYAQYSKTKQEYDKGLLDEADYQKRIASIAVDDELSIKVADLQSRQAELNSKLEAFAQLSRQKEQYEGYVQEIAALTAEKAELEKSLTEVEETKNTYQTRLDTRRAYDQKKEEVLKRDQERARIQSDIDALSVFIEGNKSVYSKLLAKKLLELGQPGICPICGSPYTDGHSDDAGITGSSIDAKQRELETKKNQLEGLRVQLERLPVLMEPVCEEAATYSYLVNRWNDVVSEYNEIRTKIYDIDKRLATLTGATDSAKKEIENIESRVVGLVESELHQELEQV